MKQENERSNFINAGKTTFQSMDISPAEDGSLYVDCTALGDGFNYVNWGGCQPVSIPTAARLDTENEIVISSEAIDYAVHMFEQWDSDDMSITFADFEE